MQIKLAKTAGFCFGVDRAVKLCYQALTDDSVKLTRKDFKIDLSVNKDARTITVTDNGIGMDKATTERIFEKFYQGDSSHATGGNGLGLAMVKRIVELCGGRIRVKSELNKGTQFTVYLPVENKENEKEDKKKKSLNAVNTAGLK